MFICIRDVGLLLVQVASKEDIARCLGGSTAFLQEPFLQRRALAEIISNFNKILLKFNL